MIACVNEINSFFNTALYGNGRLRRSQLSSATSNLFVVVVQSYITGWRANGETPSPFAGGDAGRARPVKWWKERNKFL